MAIIMTLDPKRNNYGHDIEERTIKVLISKQGLVDLLIPFQILLVNTLLLQILSSISVWFLFFLRQKSASLEHLSFY